MNKLSSVFIVILLIVLSCKTPTKTQQTGNQQADQLKKNQLLGVIILKNSSSTESRSVQTEGKELFFKINEKDYFIKISEGYVSVDLLSEYIDKQVVIKGEIKIGEWESIKAGSIKEGTTSKKPRFGEYIVINKVFK